MAYQGNSPAANFQSLPAVQRFNGDGSDTTFTLASVIANDQSILVSVDGVIQDSNAYSVSGTTLTFTAAPSSGTGNIFVHTISPVGSTVVPPDGIAINATTGTFSGAVSGTTGTFSGNVTADKYIMAGGSQIGQDYAYLKAASTSEASLTLRKDSSGADSIDYLQMRSDGNGLISKITGAGVGHFTGVAVGGSGAAISVVISPKGGHGSDNAAQLGGHYVMMQTSLEGADNDDFLTGNDFRNINLVADPTTYGTSTVGTATSYRTTYAMQFSGSPGTFQVDEKISQATTGAIGRVIEWDSTLKILYYSQERFADYGTNSTTGAYVAFSTAATVTGATSGATGTPDATSDSAVTLSGGNTITFTDGHANPELQPDSGDIIYRESRKPISRATDQTEDIKVIVEF